MLGLRTPKRTLIRIVRRTVQGAGFMFSREFFGLVPSRPLGINLAIDGPAVRERVIGTVSLRLPGGHWIRILSGEHRAGIRRKIGMWEPADGRVPMPMTRA